MLMQLTTEGIGVREFLITTALDILDDSDDGEATILLRLAGINTSPTEVRNRLEAVTPLDSTFCALADDALKLINVHDEQLAG